MVSVDKYQVNDNRRDRLFRIGFYTTVFTFLPLFNNDFELRISATSKSLILSHKKIKKYIYCLLADIIFNSAEYTSLIMSREINHVTRTPHVTAE